MEPLKKILYTEDDLDIQVIGCIALKKIGNFEVQACSSGQETLEVAESFAPQLVLLDAMMPGMDGLQTFGHLKNMPSLTHVPVVFITAKSQRHEIEEFMECGAEAVITKPFDPITLAEKLRDIWEQHLNK